MIWQTPGACEPEGVLGSLGAWRVRCQPRASHVPCPRGESSWDAESSWARRLEKSERGSLSRFISSLLGDALLPFLAALCCFFLPRRPRHCQVSSPVGDGCDKIPGWLYLFLRSGLVGHSWRDSVPGTHIRDNAWDNALKGMQIPYQCIHPQVLGLLSPFVMAIHFTLFFSRLTKHFCLMFPVAQDNIMKYLEILFMAKLYRRSGNFRCFSYCLFSMGLIEHNLKQYPK